MTLLRDPVKLVTTLYGFILRRPGHRIFDEVWLGLVERFDEGLVALQRTFG